MQTTRGHCCGQSNNAILELHASTHNLKYADYIEKSKLQVWADVSALPITRAILYEHLTWCMNRVLSTGVLRMLGKEPISLLQFPN